MSDSTGKSICSGKFFLLGCPGGVSGKEPTCQCRRHKRCGFYPWVGKIPWRRTWKPTPLFSPGKSHGQRSLEGYGPQGHRVRQDRSDLTHTRTHAQRPQMVDRLGGDCYS